ncbi:tyrosine-type recombinase/integrase [Treponema sp.]|uniref:tyrosine-type recombinase/integrase n=1 Tax=Treponema sp. TaxID=166 RepID=UPI003FD76A31
MKSIGYSNPEKICFHSFRHGWGTTMLSEISDQRICMIGLGHKSDKIFAHYANHIKKESALQTIAETSESLLRFLTI